ESIDLHSLMQNGFELVASPTSLLERLRALLRDGLSVGERILRLVGPSGNLRGRRGQALASGPESSRDVGVVTANTSATAARPDIAQGSLETHLVRASDEAWQPAVVPRLYASLAVVSTLLVAGLKCAQVFGGSVCGFRAAKAPAPGDDVAGTRVQLAAAEVWGPVPRLLPEQPAGKPGVPAHAGRGPPALSALGARACPLVAGGICRTPHPRASCASLWPWWHIVAAQR
ncbi:unnamed protein product, partial [Prorocentrum cordatum]